MAFASAAALAVESTNVVGYVSTNTVSGFHFRSFPVLNIGYNTANVQQMEIINAGGYGSETLEVWAGAPAVTDGCVYWIKDMDMSGTVTTPCFWADDSFMPKILNLDPGSGVVLSGFDADLVMRTAGEITDQDATATTVSGFNFLGNPFAAPISVQDIQVAGAQGYGSETIEVWEGAPNVIDGYVYWIKDMDMSGTVTTPCFWADDSFMPSTATVTPGQGVVLSGFDAGLTVSIASPYSF